MTMIGSPACPLGRLEGQARGGGEGEGRCRLSSPPPKGATPCDRPPRGAILIPRPLGVVDYSLLSVAQKRKQVTGPGSPLQRMRGTTGVSLAHGRRPGGTAHATLPGRGKSGSPSPPSSDAAKATPPG